MAENICPRCGGHTNIDEKGNVSCEYCGYKKVSEVTILSSRGEAEIKHKHAAVSRAAHATIVADYNSKINAACIDLDTAKKPLKLYQKHIKVFACLMILPLIFFIIYLIVDDASILSEIMIGLTAVSAVADIVFFIVIMSNLSSLKSAKNRMKMRKLKIAEMLATHPDGDRSPEVDVWIEQFNTDKKKAKKNNKKSIKS